MDKIKRMKELIHDLNRASDSYYGSGTTLMSDAEFDSKLLELKQLEEEANTVFPNSPVNRVGGAVLKSLIKVKHETPMLSLDKCHSVEEIKKFAAGHDIVASIKLDGISCRLIYQDGELIGAESRGNGTEGNDILQHVKQFMNVPLRINKKGKYVIDGEALIKLDDFEEINKNGEYKNSRNLTAGTLSSLDTSVVKDRKLSWYAWEVVEEVDPILAISNNDYEAHDSFYFRLLEAGKLGFSIVPCEVLGLKYYQNEELQCKIDNFISLAAEKHLPQDGVVFKFEDVEYGKSLGSTEHHNRNGIAFKVKNDSVETTLKDIEFTMGKTGILTPTAVFEPVETEGSTVERASLHNVSVMRELMPRPFRGQRIGVFKANLIIPQLRWAEEFISDGFEKDMEKSFIHIPDKCPVCGEPTKIIKENDSEVLWCTNPECKGKLLGKLTHAVSRNTLNIDGLSEATIQKFISLGWLNSIQDIYYLTKYEKQMKNLDGFGSKSVSKLFDSIEKSRNTTLDRFLYALSIPLVGKTASKVIAEAEDYQFESFVRDMTHPGAKFFSHIPGIGDSIINSLDEYFNRECSNVWELGKEFTFETPKKVSLKTSSGKDLTGQTFVVTGSLKHFENRDALKEKIESLGGKVSGSISKKVTALINNDVNSTSSKNTKAKSLGVKIMSEDEFLEYIS
ncbi:NAD-dependent DNA ligase LigA [Blautia sp. AF17-9LB]|uniref:NAD-dependent DNA ligase LigA n=1 Tax=Blautia sp. AF17-9LB TaxID=2292959 RepID=UPI000E4BF845|nr:NAD-dependent DNA ligase LigA [Blautia sp. AF17-9LB]RHR48519.1 NAD-dependent DNA ligase LigA [Blautia sp. AF17-9LB]